MIGALAKNILNTFHSPLVLLTNGEISCFSPPNLNYITASGSWLVECTTTPAANAIMLNCLGSTNPKQFNCTKPFVRPNVAGHLLLLVTGIWATRQKDTVVKCKTTKRKDLLNCPQRKVCAECFAFQFPTRSCQALAYNKCLLKSTTTEAKCSCPADTDS